MIEYDILEAASRAELAGTVEAKSIDGWKPQGGVSIAAIVTRFGGDEHPGYYESATLYAQAIVRDASKVQQ